MKIDLLTQKKHYKYINEIDDDNAPAWYPSSTNYQYDVVKNNLYYHNGTITATDFYVIIGWESPCYIDNITLESSGTFTNITLEHSMDDWVYGYTEGTKFNSTNWYPQHIEVDTVVNDPIYLTNNSTNDNFKPFECKMIKITFTECDSITLSNIEIESEETLNIDRSVLEPFVFKKFINNIIPNYKDTDIEELANQTIEMLYGHENE